MDAKSLGDLSRFVFEIIPRSLLDPPLFPLRREEKLSFIESLNAAKGNRIFRGETNSTRDAPSFSTISSFVDALSKRGDDFQSESSIAIFCNTPTSASCTMSRCRATGRMFLKLCRSIYVAKLLITELPCILHIPRKPC